VKRSRRVYDAVKRVGDVLVAAGLLILLGPLLLVVAILVRAKLGPPVLFKQLRPGRDAQVFALYKFRTMTAACCQSDVEAVASDAQRLTPLGRLLRAASIDELPQLWNVLLGQMSIVGPRPLLRDYLGRYTPEQARRHEVRPGITGWAQVNGRNAVSWKDHLALDLWYVDHRSTSLDLRILWRTVAAVLNRAGVSADGHATMEPFDPESTPASPQEDS
jgi:lipopolysaccharide/colanic/teichoic acid biosynthesis glycosyltransferase